MADDQSAERFDSDYLVFYGAVLTDEVSDREASTIWNFGGLRAGDAVLDLACGHGRLATRLAARGARVTGVDASAFFLDIARRDAVARHVDVTFVEGDVRTLPWQGEFDVATCWYTSFGYFSDDENRSVLDGVRRALKVGGRLLLELVHRDSLLARFAPSSVTEVDQAFMIDQRSFDPITARLTTRRLIVRDGQTRHREFYIRLFSFSELRDWLIAAGFSKVEGFASDGSDLTAYSRRMLIRATG